MDEPRLKSKLRVQAMLRQAQTAGVFGAVLRRGDKDAGGILIVLRARAGLAVLTEIRTAEARPAWLRATGEAAVAQDAADAYITRQTARDPDLWVVEFEAEGLPFEGVVAG